ncbi:hypothetical protein HPP92_002759 [Vanilla planifolia]|uniref:Cyclin n=1 Tax=Vanilla planifolia TaxID=51239 RepID=A0A835S6W3_VANPL|nr:hypothetical protein HPP92_003159 [Vanilla planifolia]KAG0502687.1 hypothetical protein HPP92_002759 [Vanilla planifolia]
MGSLPIETEELEQPEIFLSLGLTEPGKGVVEFPCILDLLSAALERTILKNEQKLRSRKVKETFTMFHGRRKPNIGIQDYIKRIFKYAKCSPSCFVLAYIYIERFLQQLDTYLTSLNVHRLLITSVTIAAKFIDDAYFNNAYYARVGGVTTIEMNRLELSFLCTLDFRLQVSLDSFRTYCAQLERDFTGQQIERIACRLQDWTKIEESNH